MVTVMGNSNLTNVIIGTGVTSIGDYVFGDCSSLTTITIPNSVTSIGDFAFFGCSSLTNMTFESPLTSSNILFFDIQSNSTRTFYFIN
jgi:hypothetical protein